MKTKVLSTLFGLLLTLTAGYAGINSTTSQNATETGAFQCSHWITVKTSCGREYRLCVDNYDNVGGVLQDLAKLEKSCD